MTADADRLLPYGLPPRLEIRGEAVVDVGAILQALDAITDPCAHADGVATGIVSLGLVRRLDLIRGEAGDGATIRVLINVTEPGCFMGVIFGREAERRLLALPGVAQVEVEQDCALDWTPDDMAPGYRARLDAHRTARRELHGIVPSRTNSRGCRANVLGEFVDAADYT